MRRGVSILLVAIAGVGSVLAAAPAIDGDEALAALLAPGLGRGYPGVAVAVVDPDGSVRAAAVGEADLVRHLPLKIDAPFHMASIHKTFTAVAVLRLVDQGKLALDATLASLLGPAVAGIPNAGRITVAQLLDHSSGIYPTNNDPAYVATLVGAQMDPRRVWSPAEFVALADGARQRPVAAPGEGHHYSDTNYILLGMIVERVTGTPLKRHVSDTLLAPLGMSHTWFYSDALAAGAHAPSETVRGYLLASKELRDAIALSPRFAAIPGRGSAEAPLLETTLAAERIDAAAGLVTTLPDLLRFAGALFRGELVAPASQEFLMSVAQGMEGEAPGTERVWTLQAKRLAWGVAVYKEGDSPGGFNTLMAWDPASRTLFAGFVNHFGSWNEMDFLFEVFGEAIAARAESAHP